MVSGRGSAVGHARRPLGVVVLQTAVMETCAFCSIIEGSLPAVWVEREKDAVAFAPLPESALAPGHTLVVPVEHADDLRTAGSISLAATVALTQRVARAMRGGFGATGTVVLQASGVDAEQSVPHLHFHVVPCWSDDETVHWPASTSAHRFEGDPHAALAAMFD
jgi:histidine triad (HIT) family protein